MQQKSPSPLSRGLFLIFKFFFSFRYKRVKIADPEQLETKNTIIIANHAQLNGPIIAQLCLPDNIYIWANGQMVKPRDVPKYAMDDFFPYKKGWTRIFYKIASYLLAPLLPCVMANGRVIPVYHDIRMAATVKNTIKRLSEGKNVMIFPECHEKKNNIVNCFREQFVDVASLYYKRTGEKIRFLPMYIAPKLDLCCFGKSTIFDPEEELAAERSRIAEHLSQEITRIARQLPEHKVIPFDNISHREYITNKDVDLIPK